MCTFLAPIISVKSQGPWLSSSASSPVGCRSWRPPVWLVGQSDGNAAGSSSTAISSNSSTAKPRPRQHRTRRSPSGHSTWEWARARGWRRRRGGSWCTPPETPTPSRPTQTSKQRCGSVHCRRSRAAKRRRTALRRSHMGRRWARWRSRSSREPPSSQWGTPHQSSSPQPARGGGGGGPGGGGPGGVGRRKLELSLLLPPRRCCGGAIGAALRAHLALGGHP